MFEQRLKDKIVNTISEYEQKCNKLTVEINMLKDTINQLTLLPKGLHVDLDKYLLDLKTDLNENKDPKLLQKHVELLVGVLSHLQREIKDNKKLITDFIKQGTKFLRQARQETQDLENEIHGNIQKIKKRMNDSQTLEELSNKIEEGLVIIGRQIKTYKDNEQKRLDVYDEKMVVLQDKLMGTERGAEEIKNMLSSQDTLVNQDSLTGLPNKASYDEHIASAYQRWKRGLGDLSLALADIDHLKTINDNYGHSVGDEIIKKIAAIFKSSIRAVDFIARYSGKEFIFIFERTHLQEAIKILENLRSAVEVEQFYYRDNKIDVTVSFGLTNLRRGDDLEILLMRADEALHQAKRKGRNCVETS